MKKIYLGLFALLGIFTACSDVDIPESASDAVATVSNLRYENPEGSREVTLHWDNPANLTGIRIYRNNLDLIFPNDNEPADIISSYFIRQAPINQTVAYTVKALYGDIVSKGQTVSLYIHKDIESSSNQVALLVPDDYTESGDERAAAGWFTEKYVNTGKGILLTPATIAGLADEKVTACWVMCDRIGVEMGWQNLPGNLAASATVSALKTFGEKGGNLLLTNHATQLVSAIGRIDEVLAPGLFGNGPGSDNPDIWGVHPVIGNVEGQTYDHRDHPIFEGMTYEADMYAGIYCFEGPGVKGDHNCMWDLNKAEYGLVENPNKVKDWEDKTNSTVLGTWNHVTDYCCAGIIDFAPTTTFAGRVLAVGLAAYEWDLDGATNSKQDQLERFTANSIEYMK